MSKDWKIFEMKLISLKINLNYLKLRKILWKCKRMILKDNTQRVKIIKLLMKRNLKMIEK